jgi:hypothetical protein
LEANHGSTFSIVAVKDRSACISALVRSNSDMESEVDAVLEVVVAMLDRIGIEISLE